MTRDDIERMAREANCTTPGQVLQFTIEELERFAAFVAAAEREACAKVCEENGLLWGKRYAAAIRARAE